MMLPTHGLKNPPKKPNILAFLPYSPLPQAFSLAFRLFPICSYSPPEGFVDKVFSQFRFLQLLSLLLNHHLQINREIFMHKPLYISSVSGKDYSIPYRTA